MGHTSGEEEHGLACPGGKNPDTLRNGKSSWACQEGPKGGTQPLLGGDHFPEAPVLPVSKEDLSQWGGWKIGIEKKEMKLSSITWR